MRGHHVCAALLVAQGAAFAPGSSLRISAVSTGARVCDGPRPCPAALLAAPLALRCEMNKIEASAVQRMTKGYDKLCKNCPTRLQPRVDTLTEVWTACMRLRGASLRAPGRENDACTRAAPMCHR
jgi:hypothetical protein